MKKTTIKCQCCGAESFYSLKVPQIKEDKYGVNFGTNEPSEWKVCLGCGLVFQNPRFKQEDIEKFYENSSYRDENYPSDADIRYSKRIFTRFEKIFNDDFGLDIHNIKNANILDFGCAIGGSFEFIKKHNNIYGIELDKKLRDYANKHFDIKAYDRLEKISDIQFDIIFTNNVLEHVYDPNEFFEFVKTNLKPSGILVIVLPTYKFGEHPATILHFNYAHNIMVDHVSLSNWLNNYSLHMSDYRYIRQVHGMELVSLSVKSKNKNNYDFKLSEIKKEIEENLINRVQENFSLRWITGKDSIEY